MRTPAFTFNNTRQRPAHPHEDAPTDYEPYRASPELIRAVNLALKLERPLLLEGEAGCGKTRLAYAVAYELGLPFYSWPVTSTSKAQEGKYTYDAMLRLHDVQLQQHAPAAVAASKRKPENAADYLRFGALGKAFQLQECPAVVLIDEIDKADLDFPNDLLTVLDRPWKFDIPETGGDPVTARHKPLVIITSNKEKGNLPAPFLRRCIYFYLDFPSEAELQAIVAEHYAERARQSEFRALTETAAKRFLKLRTEGGLHKKPGTSEFLDWIQALGEERFTAAKLQAEAKLPFPELLFKLRADWLGQVGSAR